MDPLLFDVWKRMVALTEEYRGLCREWQRLQGVAKAEEVSIKAIRHLVAKEGSDPDTATASDILGGRR